MFVSCTGRERESSAQSHLLDRWTGWKGASLHRLVGAAGDIERLQELFEYAVHIAETEWSSWSQLVISCAMLENSCVYESACVCRILFVHAKACVLFRQRVILLGLCKLSSYVSGLYQLVSWRPCISSVWPNGLFPSACHDVTQCCRARRGLRDLLPITGLSQI